MADEDEKSLKRRRQGILIILGCSAIGLGIGGLFNVRDLGFFAGLTVGFLVMVIVGLVTGGWKTGKWRKD